MVTNGLPPVLLRETIWLDANKYEEAEMHYYEIIAKKNSQKSDLTSKKSSSTSELPKSLASEIADARQKIQRFLKSGDVETAEVKATSVQKQVETLIKEKEEMKQSLSAMTVKLEEVFSRLSVLEKLLQSSGLKVDQVDKKIGSNNTIENGPPNDDDDIDLFGSDEETEEDKKRKEERLKAYENKKSKKPALVAKSSVVLDIKPWDDETDMKAMEIAVRKIAADGLVWGASKLVPLAYGINKLQIVAIVEDEKISVDWLQETIQEIEDLVQSVDIAAFNKL